MHRKDAEETEKPVAPVKAEKPRKKPHRGRFFLTGFIIGLVLAFGGSIYLANSSFNVPLMGKTDKPSINVTVLKETMEKNAELSTAQYLYTDMVAVDDVSNLSEIGLPNVDLPFTKATYILQFDGTIKAGFDLTQAQVTTEGAPGYETVVVTLPQPQILSHETGDVSCIHEEQNILNPLHAGQESSWLDDRKQEMEQRAVDAGIYDEAKENAEETFKSAFESVIPSSKVEIRYAE